VRTLAKKVRGTRPLVTVVVSTRRRSRYLRDLLDSLKVQRFRDFEVVVVEDSEELDSKLKVLRLVKRYSEELKVRLVLNPGNVGLPTSLNKGVLEARGEIIAFTDDDCIADEMWLGRLLKWYEDPLVGGVGGKVVPIERDAIWSKKVVKGRPVVGRVNWDGDVVGNFDLGKEPSYVDCLPGANMSFRRELVLKAGGFSPIYKGNAYRFETDLCLKVKRLGYKIVYDPKAVIFHRRAGRGGARTNVYMWNYWFARNHILLLLKNLDDSVIRALIFLAKQVLRILLKRRACPYAEPKRWYLVLFMVLKGFFDGVRTYLRSSALGVKPRRLGLAVSEGGLEVVALEVNR